MELTINGQMRSIPGAKTLIDLVNHYGLNDKIIVIEHNLQIVPREKYGDTELAPGDKIEIVHFVGGG
ncbi:sulfur carrier protein ThiS [Effusibacillus pohliae]|uniref:sulfur carrier protein ThiS n=1 Tax=Effusibacillus pohliae TaxID=232270 RepID=UPI00036CA605|nr:sulfur carrier protein ThiS [Effusibacillus pohliae]